VIVAVATLSILGIVRSIYCDYANAAPVVVAGQHESDSLPEGYVMPSRRHITETERKSVIALYKKGMPILQIATKIKRSPSTVHSILVQAGIAGKKRKDAEANTERINEELRRGGSLRSVAKRLGVSLATVIQRTQSRHLQCPESNLKTRTDFVVNSPGLWGILCDIHVPCHDKTSLETAVRYLKRLKPKGIVLNGDTLDSHELSDHDRRPDMTRYKDEIEICRQLLQWLRRTFPAAQIVFKHGNHEERLERYLFQRAPALAELPGVDIPTWCHFNDLGIENVTDRRKIKLGKLNLLHGHEYPRGGGVNPARWLYLKARSVAAIGHFHRTSMHHARNLDNKYEVAWSIGCLCDLSPHWLPYNDWDHGFATCELSQDGSFHFETKRIINGTVY